MIRTMRLTARFQRLVLGFAFLATLMAVLAPALSHFFVSSRSAPVWAQLCSSAGTRSVLIAAVAANSGDVPLEKTDHGGACPFCIPHHAAPPNLAIAPVLQPPPGMALVPSRFLNAPKPLFVWASPRARAPPPFA